MNLVLKFIYNNRYLLGYGFALTFLSSFGQTFLISLYLPDIQQSFSISDSTFTTIYGSATILSAFTITWLGSFIDKVRITRFMIFVMLGLVLSLFVFSQAYFIPVLFVSIYGLRLFGQGMMTHTSVTSMARFFDFGRGKAISFATLGHSFGEAILPFFVVSSIGLIGWRWSFFASGVFVLLCIPFLLFLLFRDVKFYQLKKYLPPILSKLDKEQSKPWHIAKTSIFWIITPSVLASAAIGTGFLLFKLKLGYAKGWDATFVALGFSAYALANAISSIVAGFLSDKFSGKFLFPLYLIPSFFGILSIILFDANWAYITLVAGIGFTSGFGGTVKNVVLAEVFGVKIIGSVRSLFTMIMVFSTALGPLFFGLMLDNGYSFEDIGKCSLILFFLCTLNALRIYLFKSVARPFQPEF